MRFMRFIANMCFYAAEMCYEPYDQLYKVV